MSTVVALNQSFNTPTDKIRRDTVRFVDALEERFGELDDFARTIAALEVNDAQEYVRFARLHRDYTTRCEEFQVLSAIVEENLAKLNADNADDRALDEHFRRLQVPMLRQAIRTNIRLLKVWTDRLFHEGGLPYGTRESFFESVRIIHSAKVQLLRPRYEALLDEATLIDVDRAHRLLKTLITKAPMLFNFAD